MAKAEKPAGKSKPPPKGSGGKVPPATPPGSTKKGSDKGKGK